MNKENRRAMKQIDREIEVENTKGAIVGSIASMIFFFVMILCWLFMGY